MLCQSSLARLGSYIGGYDIIYGAANARTYVIDKYKPKRILFTQSPKKLYPTGQVS